HVPVVFLIRTEAQLPDLLSKPGRNKLLLGIAEIQSEFFIGEPPELVELATSQRPHLPVPRHAIHGGRLGRPLPCPGSARHGHLREWRPRQSRRYFCDPPPD